MNKKDRIKGQDHNRRDFLQKSAQGLLIGSAFTAGMGMPKTTVTPNADGYQSLSLRTHEWFGDIDERLDLPKDWKIDMRHMDGYNSPVLTKDEIKIRINTPITTKPLREIAAGKKTAVILFDDITRATPANEIVPFIIEELKAGGIKDDNILFICAQGMHSGATEPEARAKLGDEIVDNYVWMNHNCFENLADLGRTGTGNHLKVNHYVMKADIKITISGIKKHGAPGYSGGAKLILPGVAGLDTVEYNHSFIAGIRSGRNQSMGAGKIYHNDCRLDMEESARLAGVDFSVQLVLNGKRQIIGLYAGDIVDAFRTAVLDANKKYNTTLAKNADVVIVNSYPRCMQEYGFEWAGWSVRPGGTAVVIWQMPLGKYTMHYYNERRDFTGKSFLENFSRQDPIEKAGQIIVFSQYTQRRDLRRYKEERIHWVKKWGDVLTLLEKAHGPSTTAAVYPYVGVQHEPLALDGP